MVRLLFSALLFFLIYPGCKEDDFFEELNHKSFDEVHVLPTDSLIYKNLFIGFYPDFTEIIMKQDYSWEKSYINYFSVIKTDSIWKMWYEAYDNSNDLGDMGSYLCYAYSYDGKNWKKPLFTNSYYKSPNNIIISGKTEGGVHGPYVFHDKNDSIESYCITFLRTNPVKQKVNLFISKSKDGIVWSAPKSILPDYYDTQNVCIPVEENYLFIIRSYFGSKRALSSVVTDSNGKIILPMKLLSTTDESFGDFSHIYNSAVTQMNDTTLIFFPTLYNEKTKDVNVSIAIQSRNRNFEFVSKNITDKFISEYTDKEWIVISPGLIPTQKKDVYWIYFYSRNKKHSYYGDNIKSNYYRVPVMIKSLAN